MPKLVGGPLERALPIQLCRRLYLCGSSWGPIEGFGCCPGEFMTIE
jgi:hypothetical protein